MRNAILWKDLVDISTEHRPILRRQMPLVHKICLKSNFEKFIPPKLEKSKIREIKLPRKFHATQYSSFIRCGNWERFCFSGNLNAFPSQLQQSLIRALRRFFGRKDHRPRPHPSKSKSARAPMSLLYDFAHCFDLDRALIKTVVSFCLRYQTLRMF